jgi:hypothetical protein
MKKLINILGISKSVAEYLKQNPKEIHNEKPN